MWSFAGIILWCTKPFALVHRTASVVQVWSKPMSSGGAAAVMVAVADVFRLVIPHRLRQDLELHDEMSSWDEGRLRQYFESGGLEGGA